MRSLAPVLTILLAVNCGSMASASQVFTVGWEKFQIESAGIKITGTESDKGISSFKIKVFKKTFKLTDAQIKQLEGYTANGLEIGGETGWAGLGGLTYCISFKSNDEKLKTIIIVIEEERGLKIEKQR